MSPYRELLAPTFALALVACSQKPSPAEAPHAPEGTVLPSPSPSSEAPAKPDESQRPRCEQHFSAFDTDADRRVSLAEFQARPHPHPDPDSVFQTRDGDTDGFLTEAEFCSGWGSPGGPRGMVPGAGMGPAAGIGMGRDAKPGGGRRCEHHFKRFDANADGNVTEQEFTAMPHAHADSSAVFAARDQNHDGQISMEEFCAPWSSPAKPREP